MWRDRESGTTAIGIRAKRPLQTLMGQADDDPTCEAGMTLIATWMTVTLLVVIGSLALIALLAVVWTLQDLD